MDERHFAAWVAVFTAIAIAIGLAFAMPMIDRGTSPILAIGLGASQGMSIAWLTFFVGYRLRKWWAGRRASSRTESPD